MDNRRRLKPQRRSKSPDSTEKSPETCAVASASSGAIAPLFTFDNMFAQINITDVGPGDPTLKSNIVDGNEENNDEDNDDDDGGGGDDECSSSDDDAQDDDEGELNITSGSAAGAPGLDDTTDSNKWDTLVHDGPDFHPEYVPIDRDVCLLYGGERVKLSPPAEEVAGFYARLAGRKCTTFKRFNDNFFHDWRRVMDKTKPEYEIIQEFSKCDFSEFIEHFKNQSIQKKVEHKFCFWNGTKQRIKNNKVEAPGLLVPTTPRENNKLMGKLKKRITPEDVTINCSEGKEPNPPEGHNWGEKVNDRTVAWLASWTEVVTGKTKQIRLHETADPSKENAREKYDKAKELHGVIAEIRKRYQDGFKSRDELEQQCAVAVYLIDHFGFRPGCGKLDDADAIGCCSLRVKNIKLYRTMEGKEYVVVFDFIEKQSKQYYNKVSLEKEVYDKLNEFTINKDEDEFIFDKLETNSKSKFHEYLKSISAGLMDGLTAKVFRTRIASATMQKKLLEYTNKDDSVPKKVKAFRRAMDDVSDLCNHTRKRTSTTLIYYIDPRIIIAWCNEFGVPIEKIYNKKQRERFSEQIAAKDIHNFFFFFIYGLILKLFIFCIFYWTLFKYNNIVLFFYFYFIKK